MEILLKTNSRRSPLRRVLLPFLVFLAIFLTAGFANAAIGGRTIGGCIFTGDGSPNYTLTGPAGAPEANWTSVYKEDGAPPITNAMVLIQNQHGGSRHVMYGTMGLGTDGNCWEAVIPPVANGKNTDDLIVTFAAPGHAVTSREWTFDNDGRFSKSNWGVLPSLTVPHWSGGTTMGEYVHPTGLHTRAGGKVDGAGEPYSTWATGAQDAYLMAFPQKTTSALHYVFYDNFTDGNDNGPLIDWPVNGATVNVFNEDGILVASQKTGYLGTPAGGGGFITDDGVVFAGSAADGYVYFTGLPGNDEYKIEVDPSTVTQADNPHFTLNMANVSSPSCTGTDGHYDYEKTECKWRQTYSEEGTHAGEIYAWPGTPGTMDGGYLTWHAIVEKLPASIDSTGNPLLNGTITGTLIDQTGADPLEAPVGGHGGRVPPTNARFENGTAWNRTRSAAGWGATPDPTAPASDVIPNSRVMDGRVVLYSLNGPSPRVVGTAVATSGQDVNDPANGGEFTFTDVPPGNYGLYAMDLNLYYVTSVGTNVNLTPGGTVSVPMLYERWGARTMGFVERNGAGEAGLTVKKWYKAGTTKYATTTNVNGWFLDPMWWETGQMGTQYVDPVNGSTWRGKIVTEQYQDIPTIIEPNVIYYNWLTHNSMSRAVGYATHNYFVDLQIEDIPATVGNLIGAVFNDHFSSSTNKGNGVYDEAEDRLLQGKTVELYYAPTGVGATCADLATTPGTPAGTRKTGKFSKADAVKAGWNKPYSYPADEIGSMHASPVLFFPSTGAGVYATPPADYVASTYPNIGTSVSETANFIASANYAPMPGFYEFRDLTPGNYCVRTIPGAGKRRSPDSNVEPGGFRAVNVIAGRNSRVDLGTNTTPTSTATVAAGTAICNGYVAADPLVVPPVVEVLGSCSNNTAYSCSTDLHCEGIAHPFGIKQSGEIEGGMWDGMQAVDGNPTSLLFMDAIAMFGSPIEVKDGNDYFLGVGYQGDTRCHAYNNGIHTPGNSMLEATDPNYDPFACRSTINTSSKPELERRFAPGANRYRGNAAGYLWTRFDVSVPAYWGGQSVRGMTTIHNPAYETMELGIGVSQAGYKFEAAWTPLVKTTGAGLTYDFCSTGISGMSGPGETWSAVATITVADGWSPVVGAEVFGTWSTGAGKSCITDAAGQCSVFLEKANQNATNVTFSINKIVPDQNQSWYVYNSNPATGPLEGVCATNISIYAPGYTGTVLQAPLQCEDGIDNDGNGLIDFPADPGCTSATDNTEFTPPPPPPTPVYACSDEIDNDGDGVADFAGVDLNGDGDFADPGEYSPDPGCTSIFDNDETDPPLGGPVDLHVLSMSGTAIWGEKLKADVTIDIEDDLLGMVEGATANFSYTWMKEGVPTTKTMSCATDITGTCTATTKGMEKVTSVSVTLDTVTHPFLAYAPGNNAFGVSTTITVP